MPKFSMKPLNDSVFVHNTNWKLCSGHRQIHTLYEQSSHKGWALKNPIETNWPLYHS